MSISRKKPTISSATDHVNQLKYMVALAEENNIKNDYFYHVLMMEAGKYLFNRSKHLTKKQMKLFFNEISDVVFELRNNEISSKLLLSEKLIDKTLFIKSFWAWRIACLYQSL